jgi:hypothetical protein
LASLISLTGVLNQFPLWAAKSEDVFYTTKFVVSVWLLHISAQHSWIWLYPLKVLRDNL